MRPIFFLHDCTLHSGLDKRQRASAISSIWAVHRFSEPLTQPKLKNATFCRTAIKFRVASVWEFFNSDKRSNGTYPCSKTAKAMLIAFFEAKGAEICTSGPDECHGSAEKIEGKGEARHCCLFAIPPTTMWRRIALESRSGPSRLFPVSPSEDST